MELRSAKVADSIRLILNLVYCASLIELNLKSHKLEK